MRASWSTVGKICHVRLYCKNGDKLRFDGTSLRQKNVLRSCVSYRNSFHAHLTSNAPWSPPGFRSRDIEEQISPIFDRQDIDFVKEGVASGGGNYGTLDIDGKVILHPDSRCRRQLTTSPSCMMFFSQKIWAYCHSQRAINVSSKLTCFSLEFGWYECKKIKMGRDWMRFQENMTQRSGTQTWVSFDDTFPFKCDI